MPGHGIPYSDAGAWELICDAIEANPDQFKEIVLDKPPGQKAYWAVLTQESGVKVYVKVQLSKGLARGRSFHISTEES